MRFQNHYRYGEFTVDEVVRSELNNTSESMWQSKVEDILVALASTIPEDKQQEFVNHFSFWTQVK